LKRKAVFMFILIIMLFPIILTAEESADIKTEIIDVSTVADFRAILGKDENAHIRLTGNIIFNTSNAEDRSHGVTLGNEHYTIDLNGFKIEYNYMAPHGNEDGSPVVTGFSKSLTINGPGSVVGGFASLEASNRVGVVTLNGGNYKAVSGSGVWMNNGFLIINDANITGNFGSISHSDGIIIINSGNVKSIRPPSFHGPTSMYGVIKDGIFTGNATIDDIILSVDNLTINKESILKTVRGGGLVVESLTNNGSFIYESGLKSISGEATIKGEYSVTFDRDFTFRTLEVQERSRMHIQNGAIITVTEAFINDDGGVFCENGELVLLGSIDNRGHVEGVPGLSEFHNGEMREGEERDFTESIIAAEKLKELGLFQGVGTNPDGSTNYDLGRPASRPEALTMLIRLLGKDEEAMSGKWSHPFTDVPDWADKYVGYAYENNLTKGISETEFGMGAVNIDMYLTFVLRALGYTDEDGKDFTWDDPLRLAQPLGLAPDSVNRNIFLRGDMVIVSHAAIWTNLKDSDEILLHKLKTE